MSAKDTVVEELLDKDKTAPSGNSFFKAIKTKSMNPLPIIGGSKKYHEHNDKGERGLKCFIS